MISLEMGVALTIVFYLVIATSYVVKLRSDVTHLKELFSNFNNNHENFSEAFSRLRDDFIRLETKIEMLLKLQKENNS